MLVLHILQCTLQLVCSLGSVPIRLYDKQTCPTSWRALLSSAPFLKEEFSGAPPGPNRVCCSAAAATKCMYLQQSLVPCCGMLHNACICSSEGCAVATMFEVGAIDCQAA